MMSKVLKGRATGVLVKGLAQEKNLLAGKEIQEMVVSLKLA